MPKSKSLPDHVLCVTEYDELECYARAFAMGHLNLLVVCGGPGLGKSQQVRRALGEQACWIDGNATAFGIYLQAFEHRHRLLVLDDVDGLYRDRNGVRLLKALCQTDPVKAITWQTDARTLERRGVPRRFTTTSRVVIIANCWQTVSADVEALEDRARMLLFEPSAAEVHRQAATWYWDQEVFDLVADHLHLLARPSLRTYVLAWELKKAGLDWRQGVLSRCLTGTALEVAPLKADPSFPSEEERVRAFVASGAGCRASYFNHARKLRPPEPRPDIRLTRTAPPSDPGPDQTLLSQLRRRCGQIENG
jgi:hypothetical protein